MADLTPVDYDPFKAKAAKAPPAPKVSVVDYNPFAKPNSVPARTNEQFGAAMDTAFGKGKWKQTSGLRSEQQQAALVRQGAQAAPAGRSRHEQGTPDAPGARDIVVPGMTPQQVAARMKATGIDTAGFLPEGRAGNQGAHLHVNTDMAGPLQPVDYDPFAPKGAKPKAPPAAPKPLAKPVPVNHDPFASAKKYLGEEFKSGVVDPVKQVFEDLKPTKAPPVHNPWDVVRGEAAATAHSLKGVKDLGAALLSVPGGALAHAALVRPGATALAKAGIGDEARNEKVLGTALMGLGPEAREAPGVGRPPLPAPREPIPLEPKLPKPRIEPPPRQPSAPATARRAPSITQRPGSPSGLEDLVGGSAPGAKARAAAPNAPPPKPPTLMEKMTDTGHAIQSVFSPETTEKGRPVAEQIRKSTGQHSLYAAQGEHQLVKMSKVIDRLNEPQRLALINDIEHRTDLGHTPAMPQLKPVIDQVGKVYDDTKAHIERVMGATDEGGPSFIKDYYTHLWEQNPDQVEAAMRPFLSRQGSGKNLKARSIPTIADGLAAGLTPVTTNPLEATSLYIQNMHRYLATHDIINHLTDAGIAKWYPEGAAPAGWEPLEGIGVTKAPRLVESGGEPGIMPQRKLYAPKDAAGVYNSYAGKGFEGGKYRPLYQGARAAANTVTMAKLGLSAYHASTMTVEAAASAAARAATLASRGKFARSAKALASAAPGLSALKAIARGSRLEKEVLGIKTPDSLSKAVNQAFVESGGRLRMDTIYRAKASGSFYNAIKRGTFKTALMDAAKKTYTGSAWDRAKGVLNIGANVIQSVSAPLFEDIIPNIKRGVFADSMADWIKAHPEATQYEINKFAIKLNDSMDNRFGEMVQDNLFWDRHMKQTLQLALLSPSWNIGTIRELAGGIVDLPASAKGIMKGEGITPRTAYVLGLAFTVATINAVTQYLMTGKPPESARDLMAARTGGTVQTGDQQYDERLAIPGNQKDVFAFVNAVSQGSPGIMEEAKGKLNPALSAAGDLLGNSDWRGDPLYRPPGVPAEEGDPTLAGAMANEFAPISMSMVGQRKQGTGIPMIGTLLGARPSPEYVAAPDIYRDQRIARERRRLDAKKRHDQAAKDRAAQ